MGYVQTCVEISISCEVRVVEIAQFHTQGVTLGSLRNLVIRTISNPPDYTDRVRLGPWWLCCGNVVCPIYYPRQFGIFNTRCVQRTFVFVFLVWVMTRNDFLCYTHLTFWLPTSAQLDIRYDLPITWRLIHERCSG